MDRFMSLIFLFFGLCISSSKVLCQFHYVDLKLNWSDAQHYCRDKYDDLATIQSMEDIIQLNNRVRVSGKAWIGLSDDPNSWFKVMGIDANSWRWSETGETSQNGYQNWFSIAPDNMYFEYCVGIDGTATWNDVNCDALLSFVCYTETGGLKTYVHISTPLSWPDARDYCRENYKDLALIESEDENTNAYRAKKSPLAAWIGLYRVPWAWSDNSSSSFTNWISGEPNGENEYCVAENPGHLWADVNCAAKLPFICQEDPEVKSVIRMEFRTGAYMTDPAINTQLLAQLDVELKRYGLPQTKLRWKIQPKKQKNKEPQSIGGS